MTCARQNQTVHFEVWHFYPSQPAANKYSEAKALVNGCLIPFLLILKCVLLCLLLQLSGSQSSQSLLWCLSFDRCLQTVWQIRHRDIRHTTFVFFVASLHSCSSCLADWSDLTASSLFLSSASRFLASVRCSNPKRLGSNILDNRQVKAQWEPPAHLDWLWFWLKVMNTCDDILFPVRCNSDVNQIKKRLLSNRGWRKEAGNPTVWDMSHLVNCLLRQPNHHPWTLWWTLFDCPPFSQWQNPTPQIPFLWVTPHSLNDVICHQALRITKALWSCLQGASANSRPWMPL